MLTNLINKPVFPKEIIKKYVVSPEKLSVMWKQIIMDYKLKYDNYKEEDKSYMFEFFIPSFIASIDVTVMEQIEIIEQIKLLIQNRIDENMPDVFMCLNTFINITNKVVSSLNESQFNYFFALQNKFSSGPIEKQIYFQISGNNITSTQNAIQLLGNNLIFDYLIKVLTKHEDYAFISATCHFLLSINYLFSNGFREYIISRLNECKQLRLWRLMSQLGTDPINQEYFDNFFEHEFSNEEFADLINDETNIENIKNILGDFNRLNFLDENIFDHLIQVIQNNDLVFYNKLMNHVKSVPDLLGKIINEDRQFGLTIQEIIEIDSINLQFLINTLKMIAKSKEKNLQISSIINKVLQNYSVEFEPYLKEIANNIEYSQVLKDSLINSDINQEVLSLLFELNNMFAIPIDIENLILNKLNSYEILAYIIDRKENLIDFQDIESLYEFCPHTPEFYRYLRNHCINRVYLIEDKLFKNKENILSYQSLTRAMYEYDPIRYHRFAFIYDKLEDNEFTFISRMMSIYPEMIKQDLVDLLKTARGRVILPQICEFDFSQISPPNESIVEFPDLLSLYILIPNKSKQIPLGSSEIEIAFAADARIISESDINLFEYSDEDEYTRFFVHLAALNLNYKPTAEQSINLFILAAKLKFTKYAGITYSLIANIPITPTKDFLKYCHIEGCPVFFNKSEILLDKLIITDEMISDILYDDTINIKSSSRIIQLLVKSITNFGLKKIEDSFIHFLQKVNYSNLSEVDQQQMLIIAKTLSPTKLLDLLLGDSFFSDGGSSFQILFFIIITKYPELFMNRMANLEISEHVDLYEGSISFISSKFNRKAAVAVMHMIQNNYSLYYKLLQNDPYCDLMKYYLFLTFQPNAIVNADEIIKNEVFKPNQNPIQAFMALLKILPPYIKDIYEFEWTDFKYTKKDVVLSLPTANNEQEAIKLYESTHHIIKSPEALCVYFDDKTPITKHSIMFNGSKYDAQTLIDIHNRAYIAYQNNDAQLLDYQPYKIRFPTKSVSLVFYNKQPYKSNTLRRTLDSRHHKMIVHQSRQLIIIQHILYKLNCLPDLMKLPDFYSLAYKTLRLKYDIFPYRTFINHPQFSKAAIDDIGNLLSNGYFNFCFDGPSSTWKSVLNTLFKVYPDQELLVDRIISQFNTKFFEMIINSLYGIEFTKNQLFKLLSAIPDDVKPGIPYIIELLRNLIEKLDVQDYYKYEEMQKQPKFNNYKVELDETNSLMAYLPLSNDLLVTAMFSLTPSLIQKLAKGYDKLQEFIIEVDESVYEIPQFANILKSVTDSNLLKENTDWILPCVKSCTSDCLEVLYKIWPNNEIIPKAGEIFALLIQLRKIDLAMKFGTRYIDGISKESDLTYLFITSMDVNDINQVNFAMKLPFMTQNQYNELLKNDKYDIILPYIIVKNPSLLNNFHREIVAKIQKITNVRNMSSYHENNFIQYLASTINKDTVNDVLITFPALVFYKAFSSVISQNIINNEEIVRNIYRFSTLVVVLSYYIDKNEEKSLEFTKFLTNYYKMIGTEHKYLAFEEKYYDDYVKQFSRASKVIAKLTYEHILKPNYSGELVALKFNLLINVIKTSNEVLLTMLDVWTIPDLRYQTIEYRNAYITLFCTLYRECFCFLQKCDELQRLVKYLGQFNENLMRNGQEDDDIIQLVYVTLESSYKSNMIENLKIYNPRIINVLLNDQWRQKIIPILIENDYKFSSELFIELIKNMNPKKGNINDSITVVYMLLETNEYSVDILSDGLDILTDLNVIIDEGSEYGQLVSELIDCFLIKVC